MVTIQMGLTSSNFSISYLRSSKLKSGLRRNRIKQFFPQQSFVFIVGQPQDIHASVCSGQMHYIVIPADTNSWFHSLESKSWRP